MNTSQLYQGLTQQIIIRSGLDQHREYLGISKIGDCPRHAVHEYYHGPEICEETHRMCFAGYEHELSIIELLSLAGLAKASGMEVVAPFDSRLRGHIDALTADGDLLEVKSVSTRKFQQVTETHRSLQKHFMQTQLYLRYGRWQQAFVIYRCRETYEHVIIRVPYLQTNADRYEEKAKLILRYIDMHELPPCECGRCK